MEDILIYVALIGIVAVIIGVVALVSKRADNQRTTWANANGWTQDASSAQSMVAEFSFIPVLRTGVDHAAFELLRRDLDGAQAVAFTHQYDRVFGVHEPHNRVYHSVVALQLDDALADSVADIAVYEQTVWRRISGVINNDDIVIDVSPEFSRKFRVVSPDRAAAIEFCDAEMASLLLANPTDSLHINGAWIACVRTRVLDVDEIAERLERLDRIRQQIATRTRRHGRSG